MSKGGSGRRTRTTTARPTKSFSDLKSDAEKGTDISATLPALIEALVLGERTLEYYQAQRALVLAARNDPSVVLLLADVLGSRDYGSRERAASTLVQIAMEGADISVAVPALTAVLSDANLNTRQDAVRALTHHHLRGRDSNAVMALLTGRPDDQDAVLGVIGYAARGGADITVFVPFILDALTGNPKRFSVVEGSLRVFLEQHKDHAKTVLQYVERSTQAALKRELAHLVRLTRCDVCREIPEYQKAYLDRDDVPVKGLVKLEHVAETLRRCPICGTYYFYEYWPPGPGNIGDFERLIRFTAAETEMVVPILEATDETAHFDVLMANAIQHEDETMRERARLAFEVASRSVAPSVMRSNLEKLLQHENPRVRFFAENSISR